jgi:dTDP-4-dehydrorhamnose 3,5-epimerase
VGVIPFEVAETEIEGLFVITAKQVEDARGTVREFFRTSAYDEAGVGITGPWLQVNLTWTRQGGVRGMHGEQVRKLVGVAGGEAFGAYVDARAGSPTLGKVVTVELRVGTEVLVPPGVCNGFQSVSEGGTQYLYCFDVEWTPGMESVAVNPFDPALGIPWPLAVDVSDESLVSAKDAGLPALEEVIAGRGA